jgi:hypothetical protein
MSRSAGTAPESRVNAGGQDAPYGCPIPCCPSPPRTGHLCAAAWHPGPDRGRDHLLRGRCCSRTSTPPGSPSGSRCEQLPPAHKHRRARQRRPTPLDAPPTAGRAGRLRRLPACTGDPSDAQQTAANPVHNFTSHANPFVGRSATGAASIWDVQHHAPTTTTRCAPDIGYSRGRPAQPSGSSFAVVDRVSHPHRSSYCALTFYRRQ